ncbi:MAG: GNAT family N-acetyltransferase [Cellulomonas sp.]|nr:GNAT family N-acetyltransferase [Cellulomonas sp.]
MADRPDPAPEPGRSATLPTSITVRDLPVLLRRACPADVPAIVSLLADDQHGAVRDGVRTSADLAAYLDAFEAIDADPGELLLIAQVEAEVAGTLQLSFIPGLARRGALRCQVEAVRVRGDLRGRGLGAAMLEWAIGTARERGCALVQLTSDKTRPAAHRLYHRLGFCDSHEGFKLRL